MRGAGGGADMRGASGGVYIRGAGGIGRGAGGAMRCGARITGRVGATVGARPGVP
jgi:hypothetical protein